MLPVGTTRYIDFRLADVDSLPVPGRTLAGWTGLNHLTFLRNMLPCADLLTLRDYGDGRYTISYTPSAAGHDYLEIYDPPTDIRVTDVEDVVSLDWALGGTIHWIPLDHDYGGTDNLRVTADQPDGYTLSVYSVEAWNQNQRDDASAAGLTALDANGRWRTSIPLQAGAYNLVLRRFRETQIFRYNLQVS